MHRFTSVLALLLVLPLAAVTSGTHAQTGNNNPSGPEIKLPENPYLVYLKPRQWQVRQQLHLLIPQHVYLGYFNEIRAAPESDETFSEGVEFVFPVITDSATAWANNKEITGAITINSQNRTADYTLGYAPKTNAPYSIWKINLTQDTRIIRFDHTAYITSVDTRFNEDLASQLPWPDQWPAEVAGFLTPIIDPINAADSPPDETVITDLVKQWTLDNDLTTVSPVIVAKYLTGKVVEHMRVNNQSLIVPVISGYQKSLASNQGPGSAYTFGYSGFYAGFDVRNADESAQTKRGSRHDMTVLLTAVLRAAKIPARTVIGVDNEESGTDRIASWTEFAIYDPDLDLAVWIPIDTDELRKRGVRASDYQRPWKFFGTNDKLHAIAPIAFYFHPPAAYQSFEVPALYGIRSSEELPFFAEQIITFGINRKAIRGDDKKDDE